MSEGLRTLSGKTVKNCCEVGERFMDKEFDKRYKKAVSAAKKADRLEPRAEFALYDSKKKRIIVELTNGATFIFPPELAQELSEASVKELKAVSITPSGEGLRWESLDVDLSLPALMTGVFGSKTWMTELGRSGGKSVTEAKANAARRNGLRGGRPRKSA